MNQAYQGEAAMGSNKPREPNLNERLNRLSERLQNQCERIESVLSRVNGTPTATARAPGSLGDVAKINPSLPLATVVEHLEAVQSRLTELACGVERIA